MKFAFPKIKNRKNLRYQIIRRLFGLKHLLLLQFKESHGYYPDIDHPLSLSQKLMWIKLHHRLDDLSPYVDKLKARDFVSKTIGEAYLIPLLGVFDSFDEIDFDTLPNQFVMKASHGCKWNIIVKDKNNFNKQQAEMKFNRWLKMTYGTVSGETCYRPLKGKILIEKYLEEESGYLTDFKFYCCNGQPLGLHVDFDRFGQPTYRVYDTQWQELLKSKPSLPVPPILAKPSNFDDMLELCRKLSAGFSYVRVDLYNLNNQIYFGELTFTPGDGRAVFNPVWADYFFGEPLDIKTYRPRFCDQKT
ncbi:MAG: ATP-grasp fold amidoligase family protein [Verrucomicrobiota bacterium]